MQLTRFATFTFIKSFCEFNWDRRGGGGRGASRGKQEGANLDERHGRRAPSIRRAHKPAFVQ